MLDRFYSDVDWIAKKVVPVWASLTGLSLIAFSFFGENLHWLATAFQIGGGALAALGICWWISENGIPSFLQRHHPRGLEQIHSSYADVEYWKGDDGFLYAQHGGHSGAMLRVRKLFGGRIVIHSPF